MNHSTSTLADELREELEDERKSSLALMKLLADERHKSEALAASLDRLTSDKARLATELAESQTGRDKLIARDVENHLRIQEMEAALRKKGHEPNCDLAPCDCGLDAVLTPTETPVAQSKSQQKRFDAMTAPETEGKS